MRKLVFIVMMALSVSIQSIAPNKATQTEFCDGWEEGYCEGWRDVRGDLVPCPPNPPCPVPAFGQNTYKHGYNRAFKAGMKAAKY